MGKDYPYYCLWRLLEPNKLSTIDAFNAYPPDARQRHFLCHTKEELVDFAGHPLYPTRTSDTLSYDLTPGEISEQSLYDATTQYIATIYNRAQTFNRSAARLAMSVFQRRLASSTFALLRSFERRCEKLTKLIEEDTTDGEEEHEQREDDLPGGVLATSLANLEQELVQVQWLLEMARRVYALGEESKDGAARLCPGRRVQIREAARDSARPTLSA